MSRRPLGITVLALSFWVSVPWMALLGGLWLVDPAAHEAIIRGLSPGGSGPAGIHLGMGALLPFYYFGMTAGMAALAVGLWRLRNWARLVVLAMVGASLLGLLASAESLWRAADAGAWALFLVRVALSVAVIGYLVGRRVLNAFRQTAPRHGGERGDPMLWLADRALAYGGSVLVLVGMVGWWPGLPLGWAALGIAFFVWVAEADGIALPRFGRAPIRPYGCWETPLAFTVRHRGKVLLFTREDDPEHGGWAEAYTIRR